VMFLAEACRNRTVHMVIRRTLGPGMSEYLTSRIRGTPNVKVHEGTELTAVHGTYVPEQVELMPTRYIDGIARQNGDGNGRHETLPCSAVFVFIGAEPHADWLPPSVARDKAGYVLTGTDVAKSGLWPLKDRDPCPLETTLPRVLAGGDLRAGSTKRVGFAVGDGSLAVTCAHRLRTPGV